MLKSTNSLKAPHRFARTLVLAASVLSMLLLAAAGYDGLVHLWRGQHVAADAESRPLSGAGNTLYALALSPDGRLVASAGHDTILYLWDRNSGQLLQRLYGHTASIDRSNPGGRYNDHALGAFFFYLV